MPQPLLYLLAGNGSAADWWDDALPHFQHYRPVPLELPGFGNHPAPPCADLAAYAQALLAATEPGHAILAVGVNALLVLFAGGVSCFLNRSPRWVNAQRYLMGSVLGLLALRILNEKKPT